MIILAESQGSRNIQFDRKRALSRNERVGDPHGHQDKHIFSKNSLL